MLESQTLQVGGMPISCSQVPTRSLLLSVNHMIMPTFHGHVLCQSLAIIWAIVVFLRWRSWMKSVMEEVDDVFRMLV